LYDTCAQFRAENVCLQKHITDYHSTAKKLSIVDTGVPYIRQILIQLTF